MSMTFLYQVYGARLFGAVFTDCLVLAKAEAHGNEKVRFH